jgi:hypothetical protein
MLVGPGRVIGSGHVGSSGLVRLSPVQSGWVIRSLDWVVGSGQVKLGPVRLGPVWLGRHNQETRRHTQAVRRRRRKMQMSNHYDDTTMKTKVVQRSRPTMI